MSFPSLLHVFPSLLHVLVFVVILFSSIEAAIAQPEFNKQGFFSTQEIPPEHHTQFTLAVDDRALAQTGEVHVAFFQTLQEGWHTYWRNPGDSGISTKIHWKTPEGLKIREKELRWSAPQKISADPFINFGYKHKGGILVQTLVFPPESIAALPRSIEAKIETLVCRDICIPETHTLSFTLPNTKENTLESVRRIEEAWASLPDEKGWETRLWEDNEGNLLVFINDKAARDLLEAKEIDLFPEEWGLIDNTENTSLLSLSSREDVIVLSHPRGERALHDVPVTKLVLTGKDKTGAPFALRLSALVQPFSSSPTVSGEASGDTPPTLFLALLFAFMGGVILNLMPCVFPILSMKALSLIALKDKESTKAFKQGGAYTAGVLVTFTVMAGLLILFQQTGEQIGWGFQLQNPLMILFLVYLFFVLGLNLLGYALWNGGRLTSLGGRISTKGGALGSFFTGVLATFVATPCSAPFMGAAIGFALTQSPFVALPIFWFLGFGLAFPYLLLCFVPALRHRLPRSGAWTETFRQFLSFPMMASACWLLWILTEQTGSEGLSFALCGLLAIAFGLWLVPLSKGHIILGPIRFFMILASFSVMIWTFPLLHATHDSALPISAPERLSSGIPWLPFSEPAIREAQEKGQGVFVDMTAAWCITCKMNAYIALNVSQTEKLFSENNIVALRGDWTNRDPEISKFLARFGRSGVPLYVYFPPKDKEDASPPAPRVLPQILTPGIIARAVSP